jgi:S-layer homology domain
MSLRKLSATLLAGTVTLAGTAMLTAAPAAALTPVSELKDVSPDHWAYNAIQTLVEKYQVMEGFPDRTFRGNKTLTRYELAAALAKVMARVEQRIAQATGQPVEVEPGVNPEDLRTIARLQREFREELDALKARVDTIDSRVMALEKRVRVSGKMQADMRDFTSAPGNAALHEGRGLTGGVTADFRVRNALMFDAQLMEDLAFMGQLNVDVYNPQSFANPYLRGTTAAPITDVYVPKAVVGYNPGWINYTAGIGALRDHMALGSTLADPFKSNIWTNATGGYGFVGTPGLSGTNAIGTAGAPVWLPGTNVVVDLVDPNNSQAYEPTGNAISAAQANLGPLKVGFGVQRGALTGPYVQAGSITNPGAGMAAGLPATVPGLMTWQQGSFGVITAGLDLGLARLQVLANSPVTTLGQTAVSDKVLAGSLDLGSDALGLTAEVATTSNFMFSGLNASKGSVRLGSANLFDTGFGLALGLVAGDNGFGGLGANNVSGGFATGTAATFPAAGTGGTSNLFAGGADYHSWGLMLKTPAFFIIPSLTLAAQNTGTGLNPAGLGATSPSFASGATIQTDFQLFGLPTLTAEYSLGKFGTTGDQTIWGSSPWTHEQLALRTQVKF